MAQVPGSAGLVLVDGLVHLDQDSAVFEAMLAGWSRQQKSRLLSPATIGTRINLLRRFNTFAESFPWAWTPGDVEDFTVSFMSGSQRLAPSTVRGYHLTLRMFCDYLTDARYDWPRQCRDRFDQVPTQVCHEWNTVAHLNDYEGRPGRRPFTYDELQVLFDYLDERVERVALLNAGDHPALWVSERLSRVSTVHLGKRFAWLRDGAGLDPALSLHCLRHSYVTHLIEFGYPERFVQEQVGHAYASTTAIYASVSNDFKTKTLQAALKRVYAPTEQKDQ